MESTSIEPDDPAMAQQTPGASSSSAASTPGLDHAQPDDTGVLARKAKKAQVQTKLKPASPSRRKTTSKITTHIPTPSPPTASSSGHRHRNNVHTDVSIGPFPSPPSSTSARPLASKDTLPTASGSMQAPSTSRSKPRSVPQHQLPAQSSSRAGLATSNPSHTFASTTIRRTNPPISTAQPRSRPQAPTLPPPPAAHSSSPSLPSSHAVSSSPAPDPPNAVAGVKRRLGMGRPHTGYANKKFKPPGQ